MWLLNRTIYSVANALRKAGVDFHERNDERVKNMQRDIQRLGKIEFKIEHYPDGSWTAESSNIDGIITGGANTSEIPSMIRDATFTYFGIPPHLCNDALLKADNEPVTVIQRVYVTQRAYV